MIMTTTPKNSDATPNVFVVFEKNLKDYEKLESDPYVAECLPFFQFTPAGTSMKTCAIGSKKSK